MKTCKTCGFVGDAELFRKNSRLCKPCNNAYLAENYRANKDERLAKQKIYVAANRERRNHKSREWNKRNPEKRREIERKRYEKNRALCNLRSRMYKALKGYTKGASTLPLTGVESIEQLKAYIESKFQPGMSWDNYGLWHIDHIKPCSAFDFSITEQQFECFHYTNLQPLWKLDNLKKGSTLR